MAALGNNPIAETVISALVRVTGMSDGLAGDCAVGVSCASNADCAAGSCNLATARCQ